MQKDMLLAVLKGSTVFVNYLGEFTGLCADIASSLVSLSGQVGSCLVGLFRRTSSVVACGVDGVGSQGASLVDEATLGSSRRSSSWLDVLVGRVQGVGDEASSLVHQVAQGLLSRLSLGLTVLGGRVGDAGRLGLSIVGGR